MAIRLFVCIERCLGCEFSMYLGPAERAAEPERWPPTLPSSASSAAVEQGRDPRLGTARRGKVLPSYRYECKQMRNETRHWVRGLLFDRQSIVSQPSLPATSSISRRSLKALTKAGLRAWRGLVSSPIVGTVATVAELSDGHGLFSFSSLPAWRMLIKRGVSLLGIWTRPSCSRLGRFSQTRYIVIGFQSGGARSCSR